MKRHVALQQLSREHHQALKLARLACFAADAGLSEAISQAAATITEHFPDELETHFRTEEEDLLPALSTLGEQTLVDRTLAEHHELRQLNARLGQPDANTLARFGNLLRDHVRFEERELFETAQNLLYPGE
jgi:hemerythrin-like domain-containing protein